MKNIIAFLTALTASVWASVSMAALPLTVTDALTAAQSDSVEAGGIMLGIIIAVAAIFMIIKVINRGS